MSETKIVFNYRGPLPYPNPKPEAAPALDLEAERFQMRVKSAVEGFRATSPTDTEKVEAAPAEACDVCVIAKEEGWTHVHHDLPKTESPQAEGSKRYIPDLEPDGDGYIAIMREDRNGQYIRVESQPSSLAVTFDSWWSEAVSSRSISFLITYDEKKNFAQRVWNAARQQSQPVDLGVERLRSRMLGLVDGFRAAKSEEKYQPVIEPHLLDAINWLMGCGDSDFMKPEGAPTYWWRSRFAERAGIEYDPELQQYRQREQKERRRG